MRLVWNVARIVAEVNKSNDISLSNSKRKVPAGKLGHVIKGNLYEKTRDSLKRTRLVQGTADGSEGWRFVQAWKIFKSLS